MAREEHDREDLLAEAKALVERVSLRIVGAADEVIVGFRRDGCASVYMNTDRAYHFNTAGQLRRAYVDGLLVKAEHARLASLRRERAEGAVELVRHDLCPQETQVFLDTMRRALEALGSSLATGSFEVKGQVPEGADVVGRVRGWLAALPAEPQIAASPRAT
jgi:hypothetical protein